VKLIIHLGIHKTGTTFLQKNVFPNLPLLYLNQLELKAFYSYILFEDDLTFNPKVAYNLFYQVLIKKFKNFTDSDTVVISNEDLYGIPWIGTIIRKRNIDRLLIVFDELQFILTIRNQYTLMESLYSQYVKSGGIYTTKKLLSSYNYPLIFDKKYFFYHDYINYIQIKGRITILLYEELLLNKYKYYQALLGILNKDIHQEINSFNDFFNKRNISLPFTIIKILRNLNKLFSSRKNPSQLFSSITRNYIMIILEKISLFIKNKKNRKHFSLEQYETFLNGCEEDNKKLMRNLKLPLDKYNYPGC